MWFYLIMIALCLVPGEGNNKKTCFSPMVCSDGDVTRRDWLEVDRTPQNQNYNNVNGQRNQFANLGSGQQQDGTLIKTLLKEDTEDLLSEFKKLTDSLSSENAKQEMNIENLNTTMYKMTSDLGNLKKIFKEKMETSSIKNAKEISGLRSQLEALNDSVVNENAKIARKFENLSSTIKKDVGEVSSQLNSLSEAQNQENLKQQDELLKLKNSLEKQTDELQDNLTQLSSSAAIENAKLLTKIEENVKNLNEIMEKNVGEVSSQLNSLSEEQSKENLKQQDELLTLKQSLGKLTSDLSNLKKTSDAKIENLSSKMKRIHMNMNNLERTSNAKIENLNSKMKTAIDNLNTKFESSLEGKMQILKAEIISKMENSPPMKFLKGQGLCEVQYKNSCFWPIVHYRSDVTYAEAERLCKKSGGQVADIYDKKHYESVLKMLRTKMLSSWSHFWVANKYNPITRVATARKGGQAFVWWRPGFPVTGSRYSSWTAFFIKVEEQKSSNDQGMANYYNTWQCHGAVCEI